MPSRRIRLAAIALATTALAGCGGTHVDGTARPGEIDVRTLDVGNYPTDPLETRYHYYPDLMNGVVLAEMRLDGQMAVGPEIDPTLKYGTGAKGFNTAEDAAQILAKVSQPILEANGLLFGDATGSADRQRDTGEALPKDSNHTFTVVLQFPDAAAATKAAADLEQADFQVAADVNQPVSLSKYPDAHAHWRPGIATLGSFLAHGSYVVNTMVGTKDSDLTALTDLTQKVYDAQLPLLDALKPLDREGILRLKWDPDGMLRQVLNPNGFGIPDYESEFASTERGLLNRVDDQDHWRRMLSDSGIDRFALSGSSYEGPTLLFRARDPEAARKFWSAILDPAFPGPIDAPPKVPDTRCGEGKTDGFSDKKRYRCAIAYRRYVATVDADQLSDVYQRAAAQYALMANSTW